MTEIIFEKYAAAIRVLARRDYVLRKRKSALPTLEEFQDFNRNLEEIIHDLFSKNKERTPLVRRFVPRHLSRGVNEWVSEATARAIAKALLEPGARLPRVTPVGNQGKGEVDCIPLDKEIISHIAPAFEYDAFGKFKSFCEKIPHYTKSLREHYQIKDTEEFKKEYSDFKSAAVSFAKLCDNKMLLQLTNFSRQEKANLRSGLNKLAARKDLGDAPSALRVLTEIKQIQNLMKKVFDADLFKVQPTSFLSLTPRRAFQEPQHTYRAEPQGPTVRGTPKKRNSGQTYIPPVQGSLFEM